ncbi:DUF4041 domain-containing protein [Klebsiella oxytoca]|uniref:DUF4041 domain-containing protein n=1 Tax=Klebsiella oxytoca TaxID=571 RepID=UPI00265F6A59|nr:DUF4041 domain-containing protein [Klebsiella oxytoca]WKM72885.1 DUF4041 domain-containing protein [Klebsiella oxytoca]
MELMHYSTILAFALIFVLIMLVVSIIKLKSAKADSAEKSFRLERYAAISDAETEAERIVSIAKQAAQEMEADSQRILDEAKVEAERAIAASNVDAKSITIHAESLLSDARAESQRMIDEALDTLKKKNVLIAEIENQIEDLRKSYRDKKITYDELEKALSIYQDDLEFADMGFYAPHFDFDTSASFQDAIKACRDRQKVLLREKSEFGAIHCPTEWTVGGSKSEGRKMTTRGIQMTARAFNSECDAAIANCTFKNVHQMEQRIYKAFDALNKMNEVNQIYINPAFLDMKIDELHLTHEYRLRKQEEREEQREIRAQMAEEKRAQAEIDRALREAEEEERRATKALDRARKEMESKLAQMTAEQAAKHREKVMELESALEEALLKGQKALSMAQQTKRGHVYIISNIGSFGEDVFKIGMTRRLDPQDRVDELGSASVPFLFDVHAMIFSEDAPAMENKLHQRFNDQRTNLINRRKEFFNVSLNDIKDAVFEIAGDDVDFIETATAQHYHETKAIRKQREQVVPSVTQETKHPRFAEVI